jgi:pimeloyl-ACP methyl ester carboxylesterase
MTLQKLTRRGLIGGIVATTTIVTGVGAARAQAVPKTFVLVSGAFLGGWCWRRVSDLLERDGHKVFAPTLTGLGERSHLLSKSIDLSTHIEDIVNVVKWENLTNVCLVAHSYAGFPASGALEQIGDRVSSIVWLDAFKPENGQRMRDTAGGPVLASLTGAIEKGEAAFPFPFQAKVPPIMVGERDAALVVSKATAQPVASYLQAIKLEGAREKVAKKTFIRIPRFPSPTHLDKALAECKADKSWSTFELAGAGHLAMLDAPAQVSEMLLRAA